MNKKTPPPSVARLLAPPVAPASSTAQPSADLGDLETRARSLAERARLLEQALVGVALFAEQLARDIREAAA